MPATADDFLKINYAMMRPKTMTATAAAKEQQQQHPASRTRAQEPKVGAEVAGLVKGLRNL